MNEVLNICFAFIGGIVLGTLFFGGLWFTVKKSIGSQNAVLWILPGFFIRIGICMTGFYFISLGSWQRLLLCTVGFTLARFAVIYVTKRIDQKQSELKTKEYHEA